MDVTASYGLEDAITTIEHRASAVHHVRMMNGLTGFSPRIEITWTLHELPNEETFHFPILVLGPQSDASTALAKYFDATTLLGISEGEAFETLRSGDAEDAYPLETALLARAAHEAHKEFDANDIAKRVHLIPLSELYVHEESSYNQSGQADLDTFAEALTSTKRGELVDFAIDIGIEHYERSVLKQARVEEASKFFNIGVDMDSRHYSLHVLWSLISTQTQHGIEYEKGRALYHQNDRIADYAVPRAAEAVKARTHAFPQLARTRIKDAFANTPQLIATADTYATTPNEWLDLIS